MMTKKRERAELGWPEGGREGCRQREKQLLQKK